MAYDIFNQKDKSKDNLSMLIDRFKKIRYGGSLGAGRRIMPVQMGASVKEKKKGRSRKYPLTETGGLGNVAMGASLSERIHKKVGDFLFPNIKPPEQPEQKKPEQKKPVVKKTTIVSLGASTRDEAIKAMRKKYAEQLRFPRYMTRQRRNREDRADKARSGFTPAAEVSKFLGSNSANIMPFNSAERTMASRRLRSNAIATQQPSYSAPRNPINPTGINAGISTSENVFSNNSNVNSINRPQVYTPKQEKNPVNIGLNKRKRNQLSGYAGSMYS